MASCNSTWFSSGSARWAPQSAWFRSVSHKPILQRRLREFPLHWLKQPACSDENHLSRNIHCVQVETVTKLERKRICGMTGIYLSSTGSSFNFPTYEYLMYPVTFIYIITVSSTTLLWYLSHRLVLRKSIILPWYFCLSLIPNPSLIEVQCTYNRTCQKL